MQQRRFVIVYLDIRTTTVARRYFEEEHDMLRFRRLLVFAKHFRIKSFGQEYQSDSAHAGS